MTRRTQLIDRAPRYEQHAEHGNMKAGDLVRVIGERGDYTFMYATEDAGGWYVALYGGAKGHGSWRCVRPENVKRLSKRVRATRTREGE